MWPVEREPNADRILCCSFMSDLHKHLRKAKLLAFFSMALLQSTPTRYPRRIETLVRNPLESITTRKINVRMLAKQRGKIARSKSAKQQTPWPRLVVFDLDYTLWRPELFQLQFPVTPLTQLPGGGVMTASKERLDLFPEARLALRKLSDDDVDVAIASRTHLGKIAHELIKTIRVDEHRTMADCIQAPIIIQSGSKIKHFQQIQRQSGVAFQQMLFFDNELSNIEDCKKLDVTCIYCPKGLTAAIFDEGIQTHQQETSKRLQQFGRGSKAGLKKKKRR